MATQARGGKPKNPMPTVIVVEGTEAKALRASIRAGAGRTHSPQVARPPGSPVHADPTAAADPASSVPHEPLNRRYLRRCWTRGS
jgi:hypothetical protein